MRKVIFYFLALLPILGIAQPNKTITGFKADKLFRQGMQAFDAQNYQQALTHFDEVVKLNEQHQMVYEMRGEAYFMLQKYHEAIDNYIIAIRQHPENSELRNSLGVSNARLGMFEAAVNSFYEAVQLDPNNKFAQENLEKANRRLEQGDEIAYDDRTPYDIPIRTGRGGGRTPIDTDFPDGGLTDEPQQPVEPVSPQRPAEAVYLNDRFNVENSSDRYFTIKQIRLTKYSTIVTFELINPGSEVFPVQFDRKNGPNAFYITDRYFDKTYKLKNINVEGWPEKPYELKSGERMIVLMEFDRIQDDVRFFHILEGKKYKKGLWYFHDIELID